MEGLAKLSTIKMPHLPKPKRLTMKSLMHNKLKKFMDAGAFKGLKSGKPKGWALKA